MPLTCIDLQERFGHRSKVVDGESYWGWPGRRRARRRSVADGWFFWSTTTIAEKGDHAGRRARRSATRRREARAGRDGPEWQRHRSDVAGQSGRLRDARSAPGTST